MPLAPRNTAWTCRRCSYPLHAIPVALDGSVECPECGLIQIPSRPTPWRQHLLLPLLWCVVLNLGLCGVVAISKDPYDTGPVLLYGVPIVLAVGVIGSALIARSKLKGQQFGGRNLRSRVVYIVAISSLAGIATGLLGSVVAVLARR